MSDLPADASPPAASWGCQGGLERVGWLAVQAQAPWTTRTGRQAPSPPFVRIDTRLVRTVWTVQGGCSPDLCPPAGCSPAPHPGPSLQPAGRTVGRRPAEAALPQPMACQSMACQLRTSTGPNLSPITRPATLQMAWWQAKLRTEHPGGCPAVGWWVVQGGLLHPLAGHPTNRLPASSPTHQLHSPSSLPSLAAHSTQPNEKTEDTKPPPPTRRRPPAQVSHPSKPSPSLPLPSPVLLCPPFASLLCNTTKMRA